jgi:hypothetical protein
MLPASEGVLRCEDGAIGCFLPRFLSSRAPSTFCLHLEAQVHANPRVTAQVYAGLSEKTRERIAEKVADPGFGA